MGFSQGWEAAIYIHETRVVIRKICFTLTGEGIMPDDAENNLYTSSRLADKAISPSGYGNFFPRTYMI